MKFWSYVEKIFITLGIVSIAVGLFFACLGGFSLVSESGPGNTAMAFIAPGVLLLASGLLILAIRSESKKKSP